MSIVNNSCNAVNVVVSGVTRTLNLDQVLFAHVGATTSAVYVNEGATNPVTFTILGDFRDVVAGAGRPGLNSGPIFGAFTETGGSTPVVINFSKLNRFISPSSLTFSKYGAVAAFTYTLLESPADVVGETGHSLQDVGIYSVNKTGNTLSAPVQSAGSITDTGGTITANTYYLKITATNAAGETTGSNEVSVTTTGSTSTITAHWTPSALSTGSKVYIGTSAGAENKVATVSSATATSLTLTALPGTSGTVPVTNTAVDTSLNTQEFINVQNVTHQIPSGTNWTTLFVDASSVLYVENLQDLVGK